MFCITNWLYGPGWDFKKVMVSERGPVGFGCQVILECCIPLVVFVSSTHAQSNTTE